MKEWRWVKCTFCCKWFSGVRLIWINCCTTLNYIKLNCTILSLLSLLSGYVRPWEYGHGIWECTQPAHSAGEHAQQLRIAVSRWLSSFRLVPSLLPVQWIWPCFKESSWQKHHSSLISPSVKKYTNEWVKEWRNDNEEMKKCTRMEFITGDIHRQR